MKQTFQPATRSSALNSQVRLEVEGCRLARLDPTAGVAGRQEDWSDDKQAAHPTDAIASPHQVSQPDHCACPVCTAVRRSQVVKLRGLWGGAVRVLSARLQAFSVTGQNCSPNGGMSMQPVSFKRHRFPPDVIRLVLKSGGQINHSAQ